MRVADATPPRLELVSPPPPKPKPPKADKARDPRHAPTVIKPETFSRILGNFTSQGLVKLKGSHVTILDAEALRALAHSS